MGKSKNLIILLISIIIALGIFFGMGEIYARFIAKKPYLSGLVSPNSVFHHMPPPYYKYTMRSEDDYDTSFETNNRGMRGPWDYVYAKDKDVFRIAVLGDSFVFGVGVPVEETACYLLEKALNKDGGRRYQVYNFGVYSFSPVLEYIYVKREIVKYDPDLVILMLDISDVQDDYFYEPHIVRTPSGEITGCDPFMVNGRPDIWAICMKYSRFSYFLDQKIIQSLRKIATIGFVDYYSNKFKGIRNKTEILLNKDIDNIYFDKLMLVREGKNKAVVKRHWDRTAEYLLMIKETLGKRGMRLALVVYPYGHQAGKDQWAKGRGYWALEKGKMYDADEGFSIVKEFAAANNIDYLDMSKAFIANNSEPLYFNNDGHWNKRGNEVASSALAGSGIINR
jgi:nuclear transport factor 2 (NTF2) superfamily protein